MDDIVLWWWCHEMYEIVMLCRYRDIDNIVFYHYCVYLPCNSIILPFMHIFDHFTLIIALWICVQCVYFMYLRIFGNDNYVFEIPWYLPFGDMVYFAIVGDFISFWQIMRYHDFDRYHDFMSCHEITISRYHDIDDIVMMSWFWMSSRFQDVDKMMSWFCRWCQFWPFW